MKRKTKIRRTIRKRMAGLREPNGRLSRRKAGVAERERESERDVMRTAIEARMRVFGLSEEDAKRQEGGTVIGRMYQAKAISIDQMRAAERYREVRNAYSCAMDAKPDTGRAPRDGFGEAGYEGFCIAAKAAHKDMMNALQALCQEHRSPAPISALDQFIVRDLHVGHMVGDLRLALNCLHRHFAHGERRRAA